MAQENPDYEALLSQYQRLKEKVATMEAFQRIFDRAWSSAIFGMARIDEAGTILEINPYGASLFAKPDLINTSLFNYCHPNEHDKLRQKITDTILLQQITEPIKITILPPSGKTVIINFEFNDYPNGKPTALLVLRDITDQVKYSEELNQKEFFLNQAQKIAHFGHYILDISSGIWNGSPELHRIMGISDKVKTDLDLWSALIHPDDREQMTQYFYNQVVKGKNPFNIEYRIVRPSDGETVWVHGKGELRFNDHGIPVSMIGTIQDISDLKATEEDLIASKALYHDLVETSQDLIWQCDLKGRYTFLNKTWETTFGYRLEEMLGHHFSEFLGVEQVDEDLDVFADLMNNKTVSGHESVHFKKNGEPVILSLNIKPAIDANGHITGIRGTARDITEQKIAEQLLREKSEELNRYFNTALDLLCMADQNGRFIRLNPEWEKVVGFNMQELLHKKFIDYVHPDDVASTLQAVEKLKVGEEVLNFTNRYLCKNGSYKFIEWRSAMINNIIYAAARDVTPRIEMEENLRQSNKDLQESNAQKDKFIYIIAHDLRNPLNNILGISDLLHGRFFDNSPDDNYKLIQILSDSTHSMYELIENLLNWALSQTGKLSNKPVTIPLRTLTNKIINQVLPIAAHKNVNLVNNVPESITGWADEIMMGTVLRNLISNAVKFSFPENFVEVSCRVKETTVELEVRDHGIGIRPEVIEGLFLLENVYLKKGTSGEKGTGFGLPLCAELMRIQNGTIRAESEPGNGSSFFVEFPKTGPS